MLVYKEAGLKRLQTVQFHHLHDILEKGNIIGMKSRTVVARCGVGGWVQEGIFRVVELLCTVLMDTRLCVSQSPHRVSFTRWKQSAGMLRSQMECRVWQANLCYECMVTSMRGVGNKRSRTKLLWKRVFWVHTVGLKTKYLNTISPWSICFSQRYNFTILKPLDKV